MFYNNYMRAHSILARGISPFVGHAHLLDISPVSSAVGAKRLQPAFFLRFQLTFIVLGAEFHTLVGPGLGPRLIR